MVAKKHAVPEALSQFNSKSAAYGAGCGDHRRDARDQVVQAGHHQTPCQRAGRRRRSATTAGSSCRPKRLIAGLISASPHEQHEDDQQQVRHQAMNDLAGGVRARIATVAGLSPSRRMIVLRLPQLQHRTMTTMQVSELRMSVSSGPT